MQDFLNVVLWPSLYAFLGILMTKGWSWLKPRFQNTIDNAEAKAKEIENEVKSADFYRTLLDDAAKRIEQLVAANEERNARIKERDDKIDTLLVEIERLTEELRKFKQLNGKT